MSAGDPVPDRFETARRHIQSGAATAAEPELVRLSALDDLTEEEQDELVLLRGACAMLQQDWEGALVTYAATGWSKMEYVVNGITAARQISPEAVMDLTPHLFRFQTPKLQVMLRICADTAKAAGDLDLCRRCLRAMLENDPDDIVLVGTYYKICESLRRFTEPIPYLLHAVTRSSGVPKGQLLGAIGALYKDHGDTAEAVSYMERAFALTGDRDHFTNIVMTAQYVIADMPSYYRHTDVGVRKYGTVTPRRSHAHRADPEKVKTGLRIGWISGDFIAHSLTNLIMQPFHHLKAVAPQHHHSIWMTRGRHDYNSYTEWFRRCVDDWHDVYRVPDADVAERIAEAQVDVLVDLAGYTAGNRLGVFPYRPAPVQAGWISGMMTPPGLPEIPYFITDAAMKPSVVREQCYLIPSAYTYFPIAPDVPVQPKPPMISTGRVNFGALNNPCKADASVLAAWAQVLAAVPGSVLHLKVYAETMVTRMRAAAAAVGVAADRIIPVWNMPDTVDIMKYYNDSIDIVLDSWPCTGCLTSAEAMWMGCPVVTLVGDTFLHRQTWTLLDQLALKDLGASTVEGYIAAAKAWAVPERLTGFRSGIRKRFEATAIRDPKLIATSVIAGLESFWADWSTSMQTLVQGVRAA